MATRRILGKSLLVVAVGLFGLTVVGATLRGRPAIKPPKNTQAPYSKDDFEVTLASLNSKLAAWAQKEGVPTAPQADPLAIARRISLALIGSGISFEEVRALQAVPENDQVRWWTSRVMEDPRWSDYLAERLSRAFVGTADGPFLLFRRRKFNMWLSDQLARDVGYNNIVHSMIAAEGLWTDTPQVNFVTATLDEGSNGRVDPVRLAGRTSRVFLAQRIDCLQCHNDFLDKMNFGTLEEPVWGEQKHFHSLASFYAGTSAESPFQGILEDNKKYKFEYLGESEAHEITPTVPFEKDLLPAEGKPRQRLALWVTHPENRAFSRAAVNRIWAQLFSRPLVDPVDDIPLYTPVPEVLDLLADDFVAHGFSVQRLIRLIIESDAFQRSSRADFEVQDRHEKCWAVFPIEQLRPEQVAGSIFQACTLTALDDTSSIFKQLSVFGEKQEFLKRFGDRGEEFETNAVTIAQRLILMNGDMVAERTKVDLVANAATRIAIMIPDDKYAVDAAFMSVLNRYPSYDEATRFTEYLNGRKGNDRSQALGDIYWAMMNSTEFAWNH
jgi:Protein of unknown function (DUF1553)/Protein of unknown function (DUF1549)